MVLLLIRKLLLQIKVKLTYRVTLAAQHMLSYLKPLQLVDIRECIAPSSRAQPNCRGALANALEILGLNVEWLGNIGYAVKTL